MVEDFFQKGSRLLDAAIAVEEQCGINVNTRRNLRENRVIFDAFIRALRKDEIFCGLLHIAMCCHQEEVHRQIKVSKSVSWSVWGLVGWGEYVLVGESVSGGMGEAR